MLNQRQLEILIELCEMPEQYITSASFAKKQQVSLRTIQNDIKQIKAECTDYPSIAFESAAHKGCRITVKNPERFTLLKEKLYQKFTSVSISFQNERINQLLQFLLEQHRSVSMYTIETTIFVSHSTLLNDLKQISSILEKYNLELLRSSNKVMVDGSEINKRLCIMENKLFISSSGKEDHETITLDKIREILVETLVQYQKPITEAALGNLILQIQVALQRMEQMFYISPADLILQDELEPERSVSAKLCKRLSQRFLIRIPDTEINYLAIYMRGQGNFTSSDIISSEIDDLVLGALNAIRDKQGLDLTNDMNLRIALALHVAPLVVRVKYNMQLKNHLVDYIRQSFPQGFDIGIYFSAYLQKILNKRITEEETAFLAIHLYNALIEQQRAKGTKRILIISSMRQSENILLRQTLYDWFAADTAALTIISPKEVTEEHLDLYDVFLTTEKGKLYEQGLALFINPFPNRNDYLNVKLALDGFQSLDDILSIFHEDLFFVQPADEREEILKILCKQAAEHFHMEDGILETAVLERENLGSTFFGNGIACAHPISAVSSDSFIAVAEMPQAIEWDEEKNKVHLILLVCIGKNNTKAFQLWNYLSKLITDSNFVYELIQKPDYRHFTNLFRRTLATTFQS